MKKLSVIFLIAIIFISCSKTSDQEYYDKAKVLLKENKVTEAITSLETLLKEYPESNIAPKALVQLATIYQNQLDKNISQAESFNKAQKYFREVFDKYPQSEEAPNSLFMSSFILSNELKKYDEATEGYKLFIEKYPDSPLVISAKDELDNMGLSPEEILKRKEVAKN